MAENAPTAPVQNIVTPWVRVEDALPAEDQLVFLFDGRRGWVGSREWVGGDEGGSGWTRVYGAIHWTGARWDADTDCDDDYKPTHWSPFPSPKEVSV